jgi:hypothetical protein
MPLNTQIIRDGKPLPIKWGHFHVAAMVVAAAADSGEGPWVDNSLAGIFPDGEPGDEIVVSRDDTFRLVSYPVIACTPLNHGVYILKHAYTFRDAADGERLELHEDDTLLASRD